MKRNLKPALSILYILLLTMLGLRSLYISYQLTKNYGGTDLRCRIVGTRLMATEYSPYFYHWNKNDPVELLDPNDKPSRLCNGNVVTPATMFILYPLSLLEYVTIRQVWTILQFFFIAGAYLLMIKPGRKTRLHAAFFVFLFINTEIFFYNIERGQIYTLYAFLFAVFFRLYTSPLPLLKSIFFFCSPLFVFIRPITGVFTLLLLLGQKINWYKSFFIGLVLFSALLILPRVNLWSDYFQAMKLYQSGMGNMASVTASKTDLHYPSSFEGLNNYTSYKGFLFYSLSNIKHGMSQLKNAIGVRWLTLIMAAALAVLQLAFYRYGRKSEESKFLFCLLLYMAAELALFSGRGEYNIIQWLIWGIFLAQKNDQHPVLYYIVFIPLVFAVCLPNFRPVYLLMECGFFISLLIFNFSDAAIYTAPPSTAGSHEHSYKID
jgi:hypothetical protein